MAHSELGQCRRHEEWLLVEEHNQEWFEWWGDDLAEWPNKDKLKGEKSGKEQIENWREILVDRPEERGEERLATGNEDLEKSLHSSRDNQKTFDKWQRCRGPGGPVHRTARYNSSSFAQVLNIKEVDKVGKI